MKTKKVPLIEALRYVKERRRIVKPNTGFIEQLKEWESFVERNNFTADEIFMRKSVATLRDQHESRASKTAIKETQRSSIPQNRRNKEAVAQSMVSNIIAASSARPSEADLDLVVVIRTTRYSVLNLAQLVDEPMSS